MNKETLETMITLRGLLFLLFYLLFSSIGAQNPVKQHGQLQVTGTQLCDQQGTPVTLRGVSFSCSAFVFSISSLYCFLVM